MVSRILVMLWLHAGWQGRDGGLGGQEVGVFYRAGPDIAVSTVVCNDREYKQNEGITDD